MVSASNIIGQDKVLQDHWIKRIIAFIIDSVIFWAIAWAIFWVLAFGGAWWYWSIGIPFLYGLLFFLYAAFMEMYNNGATIGKQVMNLKVVSLAGPLDLSKAFMRNISKIYGLFLFLDWIIGFVSEGDPKQKFLDRYAGTTVITTGYPTMQEQHIYQTQPGQEQQYQQMYPQQQEPAYQYQQPQQQQPVQPQQEQPPQESDEHKCQSCGGSLILTGDGRYQCIRCGKIS